VPGCLAPLAPGTRPCTLEMTKPMPSPARILAQLRQRGFGATLRFAIHRAHAAYWEHRLGIRSEGDHLLASEGIGGKDHHDYSPASYLDLERAMKWLSPAEQRGVFLDCGSGKGRIVLRAACYPFRRAIGVEISPVLNRIAAQNLDAARSRLRCADVQFVTADASAYEWPADVTCVFLYNPFRGDVLAAALENLRRSWEAAPRPIALIAVTPDRIRQALADARWIERVDQFHGLRQHDLYRTR
jgi:16S rRNA G966 N2-methylase RsmD